MWALLLSGFTGEFHDPCVVVCGLARAFAWAQLKSPWHVKTRNCSGHNGSVNNVGCSG